MRAARAADRASRTAVRQQLSAQRAQERQDRLRDRQAKLDFLAARQAEADEENERIAETVRDLESLLLAGLARDPKVLFRSLYRQADPANLPAELRALQIPNRSEYEPKPLGFLAGLFPGPKKKYAAARAMAVAGFEAAVLGYEQQQIKRGKALEALEAEAVAHNREIDAWKESLEAGDPGAVKAYAEVVLDHSPYPDGFPQEARIGFVAESKQLVIDLRAPEIGDVVPAMDRVRYVKAQNAIVGTKKSEKARQALYTAAISQIVLRTLHEMFASDDGHHIQIVVINVYVVGTDPSTGKVVQPYIVSTRVTRDEFAELQLMAVDPAACLKRLKSQVSRSPAELLPIKPIVDINMADPRFIDEQDILSTLDSRPNLMELSPGEFESLITNLFQAMGLDTKLTQASRDGGVDCVAFDPRPVLGGKVVVQAKRYKHTVGVSAVRDLFGTMLNEGASKGILVTTSGFGKAAYTFANEKPIELLTGSNLLYLLHEHAGIDAKIEPPDDWVDPVLDIGG
jgi:restriction system protein